MIFDNVLDMVGNTPLVRLSNLNNNKKVKLYAKLEKFNPGGSIKDRICKYMIEYAEKEGLLKKGMTVIEATSGNTGIGLAWICAVKGYKCVLVMPKTMTKERRKILLVYGTKVVLTDGSKGMDGAQDVANEIIRKNPDKYFMPDQFMNKYNTLAHYETTGEEIWQDTKGTVTHFVAGIGTTGTLMGTSKRLKKYNPNVQTIAVEPTKETIIPGLKNLEVSYVPNIYDICLIDEKMHVTLEEAEDAARLLALKEGLFCGPSSGAILHAALQKAHLLDEGVVVTVLPDGGERYISTELCNRERCITCIHRHNISCSLTEDIQEQ
ncbi:MAG: PLP-dependent cysteine synthase family protein [Candidatus Methanofastidiosia archaeon]